MRSDEVLGRHEDSITARVSPCQRSVRTAPSRKSRRSSSRPLNDTESGAYRAAWATATFSEASDSVARNVTQVPVGKGAVPSGTAVAADLPRKWSGSSVIRHPHRGAANGDRGREDTVQPRRARQAMPMPAARSVRARFPSQSDSPNDSSTLGSSMPWPLSWTVTRSVPSDTSSSAESATMST